VLNNGSNGFFFNKKQGSLAKLMDRIEKDEPKESLDLIRNQGPERVDKHYNWDTISKQYLNIFAD